VSRVRYELCSYILEDNILHSHCREVKLVVEFYLRKSFKVVLTLPAYISEPEMFEDCRLATDRPV
jgi:hypothetical protein